jgi:hypothetical protein
MNENNQRVKGEGNALRVDKVKIEWLNDNDPDLSWLDQSDVEMGEGFEKQSAERKESYGQIWEMLGCVAKAEVSYQVGDSRRIECLTSGGLWGIESDSDKEYLREIELGQLEELACHLCRFGIEVSADQLEELTGKGAR